MTTMRITLLVLLLTATSTRAACTEPPPCGPKDRCMAPATWRSTCSPPPFDAPVRYGGEVLVSGQVYWLWIKDGEPSAPCTAKQATDGASYQFACTARIGEPLYRRTRFK